MYLSTAATRRSQTDSSAARKSDIHQTLALTLGDRLLGRRLTIRSSDAVMRRGRWIGHLAFEIPPDHGQGPAGQIAQPVGQIGVVALHQAHRMRTTRPGRIQFRAKENSAARPPPARRESFPRAQCCRATSTSCSLQTAASHAPRSAFGSGSPAAIKNAGQYTQWKRTISLPIICTSAGQYFLYFAVIRPSRSRAR